MKQCLPFQAMSEEQLSALLAKLKEDAGLREKLQGAADFDAAVAIAQEAGFDVNKTDWMKHQARQILELSDEELGEVVGGNRGNRDHVRGWVKDDSYLDLDPQIKVARNAAQNRGWIE